MLGHEAIGQIGQRQQQRVAVDPQPDRRIDLVGQHPQRGPLARPCADASLRQRDQVGAMHLLERPARAHVVRAELRPAIDPVAHAQRLLPDHRQEAFAGGRIDVLEVEHLDGRLQIAQRGALRLHHLVELVVAGGLLLEVAGDVLHHQHEAVDVRRLGPRAHRGQMHPQQLAGRRRGHELGGRPGIAAQQTVAGLLQRVRDQMPVQHRVDRTPQADQFGAARHRQSAGQGAELLARLAVVEQDAAVEIADHHALRQLRHQRGQPVALLLDMGAGLADLLRHLLTQQATLADQLVEGQRQPLLGCGAARPQLALDIGAQQHPGLFEQRIGAAEAELPEPRRSPGHQAQQGQRRQQQQRQPGQQMLLQPGPLRRVEGGDDQRAGQPGPQQQPRSGDRHPEPDRTARAGNRSARAHRPLRVPASASSVRTRSTRSRVEKGLVM